MNEIQFAQPQTKSPSAEGPSPAFEARTEVGQLDSDSRNCEQVVIELKALRAMAQHAMSERDLEVGGILLGIPWKNDNGERGVWIRESLLASHHRNSAASFTFTHDSWSELHAEWQRYHPELSLVGWYHTHPGWGVFLSPQDRFICEHFFSQWYHVAIVLDPRCMHWGMFDRDPSLELQPRSRFWLRSVERTPEDRERLSQNLVSKRPQIFQLEPLIGDSC